MIAQNPLFPGSKSTFQHMAQRQTAFKKKKILVLRTATTFSDKSSKIKSVCLFKKNKPQKISLQRVWFQS